MRIIGGVHLARRHLTHAVPAVVPIYQTSTFELDDDAYADVIGTGGLNATWYTRFSNPTVDAAAAVVAELEGAEDALMTSSGMAAIATTMMSLLRAGDRIVAAREVYGDTRDLLVRDLPALGIEVVLVSAHDLDGWREALSRPAAVAYAEALSNPVLRVPDLPAIAALAHGAGARFVVDATFASPLVVRPLEHGADLVVHSATKYLAGHSDVVAGVVSGSRELVTEVRKRMITFGGCLDPHAAFLVSRGLQTLELRLDRQHATARWLAGELQAHPDVLDVRHPSLASHPDRAVVERLFDAERQGAMVTFRIAGGDERVGEVMRRLTVASEATSLGGVETLVSAPYNSSHFSLSPEERAAGGIHPGTIRLSVGVEAGQLLLDDLVGALAQTREAAPA